MRPTAITRWSFAPAIALLLTLASPSQAIPPIYLYEFDFIEDASSLNIRGGFACIDQDYHIAGSFGLAFGYEQVGDHPTNYQLVPFVSFAEVDAVLTSPPGLLGPPNWMAGADLDSLLNLTGLEGSYVFPPGQPGLLFTGVDGQGQPMQVKVTVENKRLHLFGGNNAGCCDMFNYQIDAYADIPLFGDINRDGFVGLADLDLVLNSFGHSMPPLMGPDASGDGYVGLDDLDAVLNEWNTGATAPSQAIPEPASLGLLAIGLVTVCLRRRR